MLAYGVALDANRSYVTAIYDTVDEAQQVLDCVIRLATDRRDWKGWFENESEFAAMLSINDHIMKAAKDHIETCSECQQAIKEQEARLN
jgi:hypothetical protein